VSALRQVAFRVLPALYFLWVAGGFYVTYLETGKYTSILWILSEGTVAVLFLIRREAEYVSPRPADWAAALVSLPLGLLARPADGIVPEFAGAILQSSGWALQMASKIYLGRAFGLVAARRGNLVTGGPYRIVRHPMYLGHAISYVGFVLANASLVNAAVYAAVSGSIVWRILAEDRVLAEHDGYAGYAEKVRYRLIPGIF